MSFVGVRVECVLQSLRFVDVCNRYVTCGSTVAERVKSLLAVHCAFVQVGCGRGSGIKANRLMIISSSSPSVVPDVLLSQRLIRKFSPSVCGTSFVSVNDHCETTVSDDGGSVKWSA